MNIKLLLKFIKRECTPEEVAKVSEWINQTPQNKAAFQELQTLWAAMEITDAISTQTADSDSVKKIMQTIRVQKKNNIYRRIIIPFSIAAAVVLLLLLLRIPSPETNLTPTDYQTALSTSNQSEDILISMNNGETISLSDTSVVINYGENGELIVNDDTLHIAPQEKPVLQTIHVPYGKLSKIYLSDGTTVHLNSGSSFVYPSLFNEKKREVYLEGEAFFEVERNEKKPFVVKTPFKTLEVLGTSFNVSSDEETQSFEAVLVTGKVAVNGQKGKIEITPNQLYRYMAETKQETVQVVDVYPYIAWIDRRMLFKQEPLAKVLRKVEKVYNVKINISDPSLFSHEISGELNLKESTEETMHVIMQMLIPDYSPEGPPQYQLQ